MLQKINEAAEYIQKNTKHKPEIAIILGSGLDLADLLEDKEIIKYENIPNFPVSTVKGHSGSLAFGKLNGKSVVLMQGRFHYYEGYSMKEVTFPVYVFSKLGINNLIVTNACGGINKSFKPGDLMIITDFINFMFSNPLIGKNYDELGERFPDMSEPYSEDFINIAKQTAEKLNIDYKEGVYMSFSGPCYETKAEIRMMAGMGADAVGMSTVPETIVANYLKMKVLGISCITNMATGIQTVKHSHERVVEIANKSSKTLSEWVCEIIKEIN